MKKYYYHVEFTLFFLRKNKEDEQAPGSFFYSQTRKKRENDENFFKSVLESVNKKIAEFTKQSSVYKKKNLNYVKKEIFKLN